MDKIINILLEAIGVVIKCTIIIAAGCWFASAIVPVITNIHM